MKGLTADGSTRQWRKMREVVLASKGKRCHVCGSTKNLQVNHIRPRRSGGGDNKGNLNVVCVKHQNQGRPRGS